MCISQNTFLFSLKEHKVTARFLFYVLSLLQQYVSVFQTLTVPCFDLQLFPTFLFALCCNISRNRSKNKTSLIQNRSDTDSSLVITFTAFSHIFPYMSQDGFCDSLSYSNFQLCVQSYAAKELVLQISPPGIEPPVSRVKIYISNRRCDAIYMSNRRYIFVKKYIYISLTGGIYFPN